MMEEDIARAIERLESSKMTMVIALVTTVAGWSEL